MDRYYSTFKYHILIALIAITIVIAVVSSVYYLLKNQNPVSVKQLNLPKNQHIKDYSDGLAPQYAMEKALITGDIVIFGSSELSYSGEEVPYRFFQDKINKNVIAFGIGGTQTLTILAQLSAYYSQEMLENSRVVIILSPGWFDNEGTDIDSLRKTMPATLMMRLLYESDVPYQYKKYIQEYLANNFDKLSLPKPIDLAWKHAFPRQKYKAQYLHRVYSYLAKFTQYYPYKIYDQYLKYTMFLDPSPNTAPKHNQQFNWGALFKEAITLQTSKSINNQYGIEDEYFTTEVSKRIKKGEFPIKSPVVSEYGKEYRDFVLLAEFWRVSTK